MFKPTVDSLMKPFSKIVSKLEDLLAAHHVQIEACNTKIGVTNSTCEDKVEALRDKAAFTTDLLKDQKADSISECIKAENAITKIKQLLEE